MLVGKTWKGGKEGSEPQRVGSMGGRSNDSFGRTDKSVGAAVVAVRARNRSFVVDAGCRCQRAYRNTVYRRQKRYEGSRHIEGFKGSPRSAHKAKSAPVGYCVKPRNCSRVLMALTIVPVLSGGSNDSIGPPGRRTKPCTL